MLLHLCDPVSSASEQSLCARADMWLHVHVERLVLAPLDPFNVQICVQTEVLRVKRCARMHKIATKDKRIPSL